MNQNNQKFKIAAIGDLHVHKNAQGSYKDLFLQIEEKVDVLLLCGDLTNLGLIEEAEILARDLMGLSIPILAVLGNHDHHSEQESSLREVLRSAKLQFLDEETFEMGNVGFAGVKGFGGGFGLRVVAGFGEEATKVFVKASIDECIKLENQLATLNTKYKIVALHYSPILETLEGEPKEIQAFLGTSRLAESIDHFGVTAVFHGHAHHGKLEGYTKNKAKVFNCAEIVLKQHNLDYLLFELDNV